MADKKRAVAKSKAFSPTPAEVVDRIEKLQARYPDLVTVRSAGRSYRSKRPLNVVTITDPSVPDETKQNVFVVGGRHGNEESGRAISLALLEWLLTRPAAETRRQQNIAVVPDANPDAADLNTYLPPDVTDKHRLSHEDKVVRKAIASLEPEIMVDVHARGGAGCSYDMVLFPGTKSYTEDENLHRQIAHDMARAGEKAGTPHITHPLTWPGWAGKMCDFAYERFKSISLLTETSEHDTWSLSLEDRVEVGLARMKALLAWGNRRHPKLHYQGYPCLLVGGSFLGGVVAVGKTAAARRASRVATWKRIAAFNGTGMKGPQKPLEKEFRIVYTGPTIEEGVGFQLAARGKLKVKSVALGRSKCRKSETDGYYTWCDGCATYVVIALPELRKGKRLVKVAFVP